VLRQARLRLDAPFNAGIYDVARVTQRLDGAAGTQERIFPQANHYLNRVEAFGDAVLGKSPFAFPRKSSRANRRAIDMLFDAARRP